MNVHGLSTENERGKSPPNLVYSNWSPYIKPSLFKVCLDFLFFSDKLKLIEYCIDNYHNAEVEVVIIPFRSSFLLRYLSFANMPLTPEKKKKRGRE